MLANSSDLNQWSVLVLSYSSNMKPTEKPCSSNFCTLRRLGALAASATAWAAPGLSKFKGDHQEVAARSELRCANRWQLESSGADYLISHVPAWRLRPPYVGYRICNRHGGLERDPWLNSVDASNTSRPL